MVKDTSVDIFFKKKLKRKREKVVSGTCTSYNGKRYKCDEKGIEQRVIPRRLFGTIVDQKTINNLFKKSSKKRSTKNIAFYVKGIPKWSQNRCQNTSNINAKTGNEKDYENHQKSCFSER